MRLRAVSAVLTLLSGGLMMFAGYVGSTQDWTLAGLITIPAGLVILGALATGDAAERRGGLSPPTSLGGRARIAVAAIVFLSGAVMVLAGYAADRSGWLAALALATVGGGIIATAFVLARIEASSG